MFLGVFLLETRKESLPVGQRNDGQLSLHRAGACQEKDTGVLDALFAVHDFTMVILGASLWASFQRMGI